MGIRDQSQDQASDGGAARRRSRSRPSSRAAADPGAHCGAPGDDQIAHPGWPRRVSRHPAPAPARWSRRVRPAGHVNYWNGDVVIVFHAKEYPSNLVDTQFASANALLDEPGTQFLTTNADFRYRNALYSFNRNAIDVIDLQTINAASPYHALLTANITLDQTQVGQFIAGINYLPREGVGIILA
jgi:hypothetical protein